MFWFSVGYNFLHFRHGLKQAKIHISKIESPINREIRIIAYVPKSIKV